MKKNIIIIILFFYSLSISVILLTRGGEDMKIISTKNFPTVFKYKIDKMPKELKYDVLEGYYTSPISITGELKGNTFYTYADDGFKKSKAEFKIEVSRSSNWKFCVGAGLAVGGGLLLYHLLK